MAGANKKMILIGLAVAVAMFLGVGYYFRLWTIDYAISPEDSEILRRQCYSGYGDAMMEAAEWRKNHDDEAERGFNYYKKLTELNQKVVDTFTVRQQLEFLRKMNPDMAHADGANQLLVELHQEYVSLVERVLSLEEELKTLKSKCRSSKSVSIIRVGEEFILIVFIFVIGTGIWFSKVWILGKFKYLATLLTKAKYVFV